MTTQLESLKQHIPAAAVFVLLVGGLSWWFWRSSRQFDHAADHWLGEAAAEARSWASDAQLFMIDGHYVRPDGVADLPSSGDQGWSFVFWSRALANKPSQAVEETVPGAPPAPTQHEHACFAFTVRRGSGRTGNLVQTTSAPIRCPHDMNSAASEPPRCSVQEIWKRAEGLGAPNPGFAKIEARTIGGGWRWSFRIPDHVELEIPDDCRV